MDIINNCKNIMNDHIDIINYSIAIFIRIIHTFIFIFGLFSPYILNDTNGLLILIIYNTLLLTQWCIFKQCIITLIENYFENKKRIKKNMNIILCSIPLFSVIICCLKIFYNTK